MDYILAIDQGTHASRAVVFDAQGQVLARQLLPVDLARPQPGWAEQDAEQIADSVERVISASLEQLGARRRRAVRCCGIATQRSTVLAWRRNGAAVSAALNWQDTRGAPQLEPLRGRAGAIRKISGLPLSAHYGATKLHWLHQLTGNDPDIRLGPLSSFLLERLTREAVFATDHSNAQRMQLFDIDSLAWSPTLSSWFDVPLDRLPVCQPVHATHGTLQGCAIPVSAVAGDQNAAWFAGGAPDPATALVNLGSGAFVLAARQSAPGIPELLSSIVYSDAQACSYVVEGTVNGAGNALQWLAGRWHIAHPEAQLAAWLEQVQDPPIFLNSVGGLGSPWWREDLQPTFVEGDTAYSDAERAAGVAESIVFLLQHNLERIGRQQPVRRVRISGGLSRVAPLCQKLANLSQCPVERPDDREATARGIAWLAAGQPGDWQPPGDLQLFQPVPDAGLRSRYERFTEKLRHFIQQDSHD
jgi:glycerol kinase